MMYSKNDRVTWVANGFNFWAFVFAWGWLLSRGLWLKSVLVMLIYIPLYFFHSIAMAFVTTNIQLPEYHYLVPTVVLAAIHLYIGFKANSWLRNTLLERGYKSVR